MSIEIERRFLVQGEGWREFAKQPQHLRQGYFARNNQGWTVRIRILTKVRAWLTLKSPKTKISNHEFEYKIPLKDAEKLLELLPHTISKTRYELNLENGLWVVDCFEEENAPLVLAEVELPSEETLVTKPAWCGKEITGLYQWSNAALSEMPFSTWPSQEQNINS